MIACIRYSFVSLFFCLPVFCDPQGLRFPHDTEVQYEALFTMLTETKQTETRSGGHSVNVTGIQKLKGKLSFETEEKPHFPIPMEFTLEEAEFTVKENNQTKVYSLKEPGHSIEMNELIAFKGKAIPFSVIDKAPFIEYPENFLKRFKDLKIFRYPILAGFFGEDLYTLFTIAERPLKQGEKFEIEYEKTEDKPYTRKKIFTVQEMTPQQVVIEAVTLIERQRCSLTPSNQVVIYQQSKAIWTIDRINSLKFSQQETGTLSQSICLEGVDTSQKHILEKQIVTTPLIGK